VSDKAYRRNKKKTVEEEEEIQYTGTGKKDKEKREREAGKRSGANSYRKAVPYELAVHQLKVNSPRHGWVQVEQSEAQCALHERAVLALE
jgi:hypothetical protein